MHIASGNVSEIGVQAFKVARPAKWNHEELIPRPDHYPGKHEAETKASISIVHHGASPVASPFRHLPIQLESGSGWLVVSKC